MRSVLSLKNVFNVIADNATPRTRSLQATQVDAVLFGDPPG